MNEEATVPPASKTTLLPVANTDLPPDAPWWARWIVANAREGWKFLSFNVPIISAAVIEADQASGGQLMNLLPATWRPHVAALGLVGVALLRFINQQKGAK